MSNHTDEHALTAPGEHARPTGLNELLLTTIREVIQTSSREAAERATCERLAESALYQFAWTGERELDGHRVVPRTTAGEDRGFLNAVVRSDDPAGGLRPPGRAMRTGELQLATVEDATGDAWRDAARARGFGAVAAAPLRHAGATYGVLVVATAREDAFGERERTWLDVLGRTIGSIIHAAKRRELLFTDAVVELEFRVADPDSLFVRLAADAGCALELDGYVPSGEQWILYAAVDGAPPAAVVDTAAGDARVARSRVVSEGDVGRVELIVAEASLLHTATAAGATVRSVTADADAARLVVEAPVDIDVRGVVDHLQREYPGAEFVARSDYDRDATTVGHPQGLLDELTDRQREALVAAYRAGYFTWPRESTAEEIAEALDIAPSTLHGHLRKAEEVILVALLDGSSRQ